MFGDENSNVKYVDSKPLIGDENNNNNNYNNNNFNNNNYNNNNYNDDDLIRLPDEDSVLCEVVAQEVEKKKERRERESWEEREEEEREEEEERGEFSLIEHGSGSGFTGALLGQWFPKATLVSLENDPFLVAK